MAKLQFPRQTMESWKLNQTNGGGKSPLLCMSSAWRLPSVSIFKALIVFAQSMPRFTVEGQVASSIVKGTCDRYTYPSSLVQIRVNLITGFCIRKLDFSVKIWGQCFKRHWIPSIYIAVQLLSRHNCCYVGFATLCFLSRRCQSD